METAYDRLKFEPPELTHQYGPRVHILAHPSLLSRLARVCHDRCDAPEMMRLVDHMYREMASIVASAEFPRVQTKIPTRMSRHHREGVYVGEVIDPKTSVVCVDIARAGMLPTLSCYEVFASLVEPRRVRQDHVFMNRKTDAKGRVVGVDLSGSKIGGRIDGAILVLPDPMAATGSSVSAALHHYTSRKLGRPSRVITMHLIVTPEYIRRVQTDHPGVIIYGIRLDRGLSKPEILQRRPGEKWREERGLNDRHYIVPGGGGFGELLNNSEE